MLKFYVSCRPIRYERSLIMPDAQLQLGFKGLDIGFKLMVEDRSLDGRVLYEIVLGANSSYTDAQCLDYQSIIIEGLAAFSGHLKTLASAQALAQSITGLTFAISGDSLVPPANPK